MCLFTSNKVLLLKTRILLLIREKSGIVAYILTRLHVLRPLRDQTAHRYPRGRSVCHFLMRSIGHLH